MSRNLDEVTSPKLATLAAELQIMVIRSLDPISSVCLGLTCRRLYRMHHAVHEKVPLEAGKFVRDRWRQLELHLFLRQWMWNSACLVYAGKYGERGFVTVERLSTLSESHANYKDYVERQVSAHLDARHARKIWKIYVDNEVRLSDLGDLLDLQKEMRCHEYLEEEWDIIVRNVSSGHTIGDRDFRWEALPCLNFIPPLVSKRYLARTREW
ncbi:hypothetical protein BJ878DRAFT_148293 [Calycina marina]|uniref:F-box domain-containing protein n=1 Tax=Calycina marina TaxID=1763456 RepID=A0A9P7Z0Y3_9HELO|nr:hypothetical protein BJ878DRAFT_148293 [Calycina marina]